MPVDFDYELIRRVLIFNSHWLQLEMWKDIFGIAPEGVSVLS